MNIRPIIALSIVGLYVVVTLAILIWNIMRPGGDAWRFFEQMSNANFLLGPVRQ